MTYEEKHKRASQKTNANLQVCEVKHGQLLSQIVKICHHSVSTSNIGIKEPSQNVNCVIMYDAANVLT